MNATQYKQWIEAKAELDKWKKVESDLRIKICDHFLEGASVGTHNFTAGSFKIKAVKSINTSIDESELSFIWDDLTEEEQDCVKYKPSLVAKNYKECEDHSTLDQAIVTKPAMPSLSIEYIED